MKLLVTKTSRSKIDVTPTAQGKMKAEPRRQLEAQRGRKLNCDSCGKENTGEFLIICMIPLRKNALICEGCADPNVPIRNL